jgi:hypothetical protein
MPIPLPPMPAGPSGPSPSLMPAKPGGFSPYGPIASPPPPPLMSAGQVPVPRNDREAMALIQHSKAAITNHAQVSSGAHPAAAAVFAKQRQGHVDAVAGALNQYHRLNPSPFSGHIIDAMYSDPASKITHPKPATPTANNAPSPQNDSELAQYASRMRDQLAGDGRVGHPLIKQFSSVVKAYGNRTGSPLATKMLTILHQNGHA